MTFHGMIDVLRRTRGAQGWGLAASVGRAGSPDAAAPLRQGSSWTAPTLASAPALPRVRLRVSYFAADQWLLLPQTDFLLKNCATRHARLALSDLVHHHDTFIPRLIASNPHSELVSIFGKYLQYETY